MMVTMFEIAVLILVIGLWALYRIWGVPAAPISSVEAGAPMLQATGGRTASTRRSTRDPAAVNARRSRKRNRSRRQPTLAHERRLGWQHKLLVMALAVLHGQHATNPSHGRP